MTDIGKLGPLLALLASLGWLLPVSHAVARGMSTRVETPKNWEIPMALRPSTMPDNGPDNGLDCRDMVDDAERRYRIPGQMLAAIALAESGRWMVDDKAFVAWPWSVYAEGKGRHFENKAAAVATVKALLKKDVRNIDVGCMQVNLHYHPDAFPDLQAAMEPGTNIDYAARLLRRLYDKHRSWYQAVARYHSATKKLHVPYRRKVIGLWHTERRRANVKRRRLLKAAVERKQIARRKLRGKRTGLRHMGQKHTGQKHTGLIK